MNPQPNQQPAHSPLMTKASDLMLRTLLNKVHAVRQDDELMQAEGALVARIIAIESALLRAAAQFDFTVAALAKGQTVSVSSLQNCAAQAREALRSATQ